jgi:hypothetical protein
MPKEDHVLTSAEMPLEWIRGVPKSAIAPDLVPATPRRLLVYEDLNDSDAKVLVRAGVSLARAKTPQRVLILLANEAFDAVAVDPRARDAMALVKAIKWATRFEGSSADVVRAVAQRHDRTPLFVLPIDDEPDYAILIAPPALAFLESRAVLPIAEAILRLDVEKLISSVVEAS